MEVLYGTRAEFFHHDTGSLHPERPARLRAVALGLESCGLPYRLLSPRPATLEMLARVHSPDYVAALERFCRGGGGHLDPDTLVGPGSFEAALLAAGAGAAAVEALDPGGEVTAFLGLRPPGHHALNDRAMGFCLFNNVAVTAAELDRLGKRVAILDWDVHHGNGTQAAFWDNPGVLYLSLHQFPFYPHRGDLTEFGAGPGEGNTVNVPLPAGTAGDAYRYAWLRVVAPVLTQFQAEWLLVSAGYDAHHHDPLAEMRLEAEDFGWMAHSLRALVDPSRIIMFLEGGYHLPALAASVAATLRGLAGWEPPLPDNFISPPAAFEAVDRAAEAAGRYWSL
jgi:acetoin utilization deacetylase AcuC-like enzyme